MPPAERSDHGDNGKNADADPYLRHAGVMALAGIGEQAAQQAADDIWRHDVEG